MIEKISTYTSTGKNNKAVKVKIDIVKLKAASSSTGTKVLKTKK